MGMICKFCGADITRVALRYGLPTVQPAPKTAYGHAKATVTVGMVYSCKSATCVAQLRREMNVIELKPTHNTTHERIGTENV